MSNERIYSFPVPKELYKRAELREGFEQRFIAQARWMHRKEGLASDGEPLYAGGEWQDEGGGLTMLFQVLIRPRPAHFEELKDHMPPHVVADWDLAVA